MLRINNKVSDRQRRKAYVEDVVPEICEHWKRPPDRLEDEPDEDEWESPEGDPYETDVIPGHVWAYLANADAACLRKDIMKFVLDLYRYHMYRGCLTIKQCRALWKIYNQSKSRYEGRRRAEQSID